MMSAMMNQVPSALPVAQSTARPPLRLAPADDLTPLLEAARAGDEVAFNEIYSRFARVVHGILVARSGPDEAEDLAQEVFALVHRGLTGVRDGLALPAWICTVARNVATDALRRRARAPKPAELVDVPAADRGSGERELRERVLARIRELPDAYRETLVLRLVEGLAGPEIAERTGLTPGSVRVNLTRGMAMLRPLLAQEGWP
jgi:RNA polymerase sigma-70 factor (ECF subfamily)